MAIDLGVPYVPYDYIRREAERFLREHEAGGVVPVPIEEIIEFQMGIDIIPIPELARRLDGLEAFISSNLHSISVDEFIYLNRFNRYRFSLAHEIGHAVLHQDIFSRFSFSTFMEYKRFVLEISPKDWGRLEWQSYAFGGLVLVPSPPLKERFYEAISMVESLGFLLPQDRDVAAGYINRWLSDQFQVSEEVINKRVNRYDMLWEKLEEDYF